MTNFFHDDKPLHFIFPIDGDCLNSFDGIVTKEAFKIKAVVFAAPGSHVTVNGAETEFDGKNYSAWITLSPKSTVLTATDGVNSDVIKVFDVRQTEKKYRISSDDNILFLRDINNHKDTYKSIFENPYLAVYKRAHDLYGAKVHINLFYETDELNTFKQNREYFNLSMMTDKFKPEFEQNSDWLRFSFHANAEYPDKPYRHTSALRIAQDAQKVMEQIKRFAGDKSLAKVTTVHWGEATRDCTVALRKLGYRALAGYFEFTSDKKPLVAYYYPDNLISHVGARDFWVNTQDDILHARIDLVMNAFKYSDLIPRLEKIRQQPHRAGFLELMIHEQYFYPYYSRYIPEFEKIVTDAAGWAYNNGYTGAFFSDLLLD